MGIGAHHHQIGIGTSIDQAFTGRSVPDHQALVGVDPMPGEVAAHRCERIAVVLVFGDRDQAHPPGPLQERQCRLQRPRRLAAVVPGHRNIADQRAGRRRRRDQHRAAALQQHRIEYGRVEPLGRAVGPRQHHEVGNPRLRDRHLVFAADHLDERRRRSRARPCRRRRHRHRRNAEAVARVLEHRPRLQGALGDLSFGEIDQVLQQRAGHALADERHRRRRLDAHMQSLDVGLQERRHRKSGVEGRLRSRRAVDRHQHFSDVHRPTSPARTTTRRIACRGQR